MKVRGPYRPQSPCTQRRPQWRRLAACASAPAAGGRAAGIGTTVLRSGDSEAAVDPGFGGALLSLRGGGRDVLRPTPAGTTDILATACWPLVPYANRIAHRRFGLDGRRVTLAPNFGDHPHTLHGVGWQRAWEVADRGADRITLVHRHGGDADWPWRYLATQRLRLAPDRLEATLTLRNEDGTAMPAGLGFHPYLLTDPDARLTFGADAVWLADATQLPTHPAPPATLGDWPAGAPAQGPLAIDHCYAGWDGRLALATRGLAVTLSATGARFLHVHRPPGAGWIGVEPVTHMPDAVNRPEPAAETGLHLLAPGAELALAMRIGWADAG